MSADIMPLFIFHLTAVKSICEQLPGLKKYCFVKFNLVVVSPFFAGWFKIVPIGTANDESVKSSIYFLL